MRTESDFTLNKVQMWNPKDYLLSDMKDVNQKHCESEPLPVKVVHKWIYIRM
jgi:hypothetical protein